MRLGGDGDGDHPCLTLLLLLCVCCCFLHSLFSIKKPFLQPVSDAHSLPLPVNRLPSSLASQQGRVPLWSLVRLGQE